MAKNTVSSTGGFVPGSTNSRAVRNPEAAKAEPNKPADQAPKPDASDTAAAGDAAKPPKPAARKKSAKKK